MDEDSILKIVKNAYGFVEKYIDPNAPDGKEHIGYIVDRTGFEEFYKWIMEDNVLEGQALRPFLICALGSLDNRIRKCQVAGNLWLGTFS